MRFSDYLKQRRSEKGWTQPEAAARIGIEQSYLSKLENGKSLPSAEVYQRLVDGLNIDTRELVDILFPADLDRLREVDAVREVVLHRHRKSRSMSRTWLVGGLIMLILGGGSLGVALTQGERTVQQFSYQSQGVILPGESLEVFSGIDEEIDEDAPDAEARLARRDQLIERIDDQIRSGPDYRGPAFIEDVPDGKRVWSLVGGNEVTEPGRFDWAMIPGLALILGSFGCFFVSRRWQ